MVSLTLNQLPPLSWILLIITGFTLFFTAQSVRFRNAVGGTSFMFLMISITAYSFGYAFEIAAADLKTALFFSHIQYLGIPFVPFFYYVLIWQYLMKTNRMPLLLVIILLSIPVITFIVHLTQSNHNFFYIKPSLVFEGNLSILAFGKGIWYYINNIYTLFIMILVIIHSAIRLVKDRKYRLRITVLLIGALFPFAGFLFYISGLSPKNLDITPIAMALTIPFWSVSIFHYSFFDIVPVARDHIFEHLKDCIIVTDLHDRLIEYNASTRKFFPFIALYKIGTPLKDIISKHRDEVSGIEGVVKGESDLIIVRKGNDERSFRVFGDTLESTGYFAGGKIYILSDVTEQVRLNEKLSLMAITDPLTGIFNRRKLIESARSELLRAQRYERNLSLVFFDIDHFKKINDTHGHQAGDFILQKSTEICRNIIREIDIFGRYGGEEFVLLLLETSPHDAFTLSEKIRNAFEDFAYIYNSQLIPVTASFGISGLRKGDTLDDLLHRADEALYMAKENGRNMICSM